MKIAVLGGYGNAGLKIARWLTEQPISDLILLGRNKSKAIEVAALLSKESSGRVKISGGYADASKISTLETHLAEIDLLVVASSTSQYIQNVVGAALKTNTDYIDIQLSSPKKSETLNCFKSEILTKNRVFITDGGFHPGVPAAMARYSAKKVDKISKINIAGSFGVNWNKLAFSDNTIREFVEEMKDMDISTYSDGKWVKNWNNIREFDFEFLGRRQKCFPMFMREIGELPSAFPFLKEAGFYIAGFGPFLDAVVLPLCWVALKLIPASVGIVSRVFAKALNVLASSGEWADLCMEGEGTKDGQPCKFRMEVFHSDPYEFTAIPAVACIAQYIRGHRPSGVWLQATYVEPQQFFEDMKNMGVEFKFSVQE